MSSESSVLSVISSAAKNQFGFFTWMGGGGVALAVYTNIFLFSKIYFGVRIVREGKKISTQRRPIGALV